MYPVVHVAKIFEGINIIELAGFQEREKQGCPSGAILVSGKQTVFPIKSDWSDGSLGSIVIRQDFAIVQVMIHEFPMVEGIGKGFADGAVRNNAACMFSQPFLYLTKDWFDILLPDLDPLLITEALMITKGFYIIDDARFIQKVPGKRQIIIPGLKKRTPYVSQASQ